MPPLWQYLSAPEKKKALELMCAPKGVGPRLPRTFLLQRETSEGAVEGAKGADHGPRGAAACLCARYLGVKVVPPLWRYLLRL
jgi:hypothetical protein